MKAIQLVFHRPLADLGTPQGLEEETALVGRVPLAGNGVEKLVMTGGRVTKLMKPRNEAPCVRAIMAG